MPGILINLSDLSKYGVNNLLKKVNTVKYSDYIHCIILIVPSKEFDYVNNLEKGDITVNYMNSNCFIHNITKMYDVIYDLKTNICELRYDIADKLHFKDIIRSIDDYLPENLTIWVGGIDSKNSVMYIEEGFSHPYNCDRSPLGFKFKNNCLAFIRRKSFTSKLNFSSIQNKLDYLKISHKNISSKCVIHIKFSEKTLKELKSMTGEEHDKELSGSLIVSDIIKENGNVIFELSNNPNNLIAGIEEEVDAVWCRYNFHTHPKKAYENHGVTNGWPSGQDFVGFLELKNHTIFHTVVTVEGIYIISFCKDWLGDINKINKKSILKKYGIDHSNNITSKQYVEKINNMKYKKQQLFDIKYMEWKIATNVFSIFFEKTHGTCLVTDEVFDISQRDDE